MMQELSCMKKLVAQLGVSEPIPSERRSTAWTPSGGNTVFAPGDVALQGCSCARLEEFAGPNNVAQKTVSSKETEVVPALLHAAKYKTLCEMRARLAGQACYKQALTGDSSIDTS